MDRTLCRGFFAIFLLVVTHIAGTVAADLTPEAGDGLQPLITTSELVVGENRFAFGLLKAGKLVEGADVKLRLYAIDGGEAKLASRFLIKRSKTLSRSVRYIAMRMEQNMYMGTAQMFGVSTLRSSVSLAPVIGESNFW